MEIADMTERRKNTSGSETRQRDKRIDVRCDDPERDLVLRAAARLGVKPATFLRDAGLERAAAVLTS